MENIMKLDSVFKLVRFREEYGLRTRMRQVSNSEIVHSEECDLNSMLEYIEKGSNDFEFTPRISVGLNSENKEIYIVDYHKFIINKELFNVLELKKKFNITAEELECKVNKNMLYLDNITNVFYQAK